MDFAWTEEQQKLREEAAAFAQKELNGFLETPGSEPRFDRALWRRCAEFGVQGSFIPPEFGGQGRDILTTVGLLEAIGLGCRDNGFLLGLNGHMWAVEEPLLRFGSADQHRRFLPGLAGGDLIGAHGMTEVDSGSDAFSLKTRAEARGDDYVLNGRKVYIGLAPVCDLALIFATTRPDLGQWGVSAFLVEADRAGFSATDPQEKMGLSGSPLGEIHLENCVVPRDNLLGPEGAGVSIFNHSMEWERSFIFASHVGAMQRQLDQCIERARERKQFGRPIGSFQSVSNRIADMKLRLETARLLLYRAAWLKQNDEPCSVEAALTKLHVGEAFVESSLDALRIHGATGYLREFGIERDLRDSTGGVIYSGTSDIQRQLIARLLGLEMRYLLPQLVDQSAERLPQHEAIRCRGEALTYETLARRSNGLAYLLVERGVRRGDRVGVLLGKSVECAVAIHGIMKAGAAYVPLDPTAPLERCAFVLQDCGVEHLVTEPRRAAAAMKLAERLPLKTLIGADDSGPGHADAVDWGTVDQRSTDSAPEVGVMEQDLAYILYTSGSTGTPKGIMHTHRSGLAWAEVSAATYGFTHHDRISNYAPLHFDLSTLDYFATALTGATTVMIPEEHAMLPASLSRLIADERLTVFYTVPLALTQLALSGTVERHDLGALRWVLFGGEPMPPKYLSRLMRVLPHVRFSNVYGPTETNGCTYHVVPAVDEDGEPVPIGKPYANVDVIVVDTNYRPVARGETGELLVRAPTMMQGYWGRADLNERAFYIRQRAVGLSDRFHCTGDLVRELPGGDLQFVGRKDRQIKTRGCRVDLDEVEAVIVAHDLVREAAVFPVPDADGHQLIQAAVIPTAEGEVSTSALLSHMKSRLPAYALPVRLDLVDDFPRTSSGKIDRRALQESTLGA